MIKVLDKAFGILEEAVIASPEPVGLAKLADKLGINKATCSRIIRELVESGYLVQVSRQSGYTAGPRALTLGMRVSYAEKLMAAASGPIRSCAEEIGQSILLAILHRGMRYILIHHNFNPTMKVDLTHLAFDDAFNTATGLLLLAFAVPEELEHAMALRNEARMPIFRDAADGRSLDDFLAGIRRAEEFIYSGPAHSLSIAAYPVFENGAFVAALGMSMPRRQFEAGDCSPVLRRVAETAETITRRLSDIVSVG